MITLQEWFDNKYPLAVRGTISSIHISDSVDHIGNLCKDKGNSLTIENFNLVNEIFCSNNEIDKISITNCPNLNILCCGDNLLTDLDFLDELEAMKLTFLDIRNNKINSNLSNFSRFTKLKTLFISNNKFYGSLKELSRCSKLSKLLIENTEINNGLEYLPKSVETIKCSGRLNDILGMPFYRNYRRWRNNNLELVAEAWANSAHKTENELERSIIYIKKLEKKLEAEKKITYRNLLINTSN